METPNTSRAERVQANLNYTMQFIKDCKVQATETSLSIIAQCQIDISYTLALMFDEMLERKGKAIPLDKVNQAVKEIQKLRGCSCNCSDGVIDDVEDILDKLIESEGVNEKENH